MHPASNGKRKSSLLFTKKSKDASLHQKAVQNFWIYHSDFSNLYSLNHEGLPLPSSEKGRLKNRKRKKSTMNTSYIEYLMECFKDRLHLGIKWTTTQVCYYLERYPLIVREPRRSDRQIEISKQVT
jgi:hypothetical protein